MNPISTLAKLVKSKKYFDQIQEAIRNMKPTNWRSTAAGVFAGLMMLAHIWVPPDNAKLNQTIYAVQGIAVAVGLYNAADKQNLQ